MRKTVFACLIGALVCMPHFLAGEGKEVWIFPPRSYVLRISRFREAFDFSITARNIQYLSTRADQEGPYPFIVADKDFIYLRASMPAARIQTSARKSDFYLPRFFEGTIGTEPDGFQTVFDDTKEWPIILGGGYCAVTHQNNERIIKELHEARGQLLIDRLERQLLNNLDNTSYILPQVIKGVRMSAPFLEETIRGVRYRYDDDILRYRWFYVHWDRRLLGMYFINDPTPMVEGASGNGVGLTLEIDYHIPSDNLVVLNGFVDLDRRHLYKRNPRMKKVLVKGDGFEFEYKFQDYVHFAQIDFPKKVQQVRLTVLEVYDGSHHEDLSISGLFTNPDVLKIRNSPLAYELLGEAKIEWYRFRDRTRGPGLTRVRPDGSGR